MYSQEQWAAPKVSKKLSKEGIYIENNTVKQTLGNELCLYCDKVTGTNCELFRSVECIHRDS